MPRSVLVVDNQPVIVEFLTNALTKEGFECASAVDGLSALVRLQSIVPDVLITDLVMPNIDGAHLCRIVRATPRLRDTFIIVLSAIAAEQEIRLADLGANACVAKGPLNKMKDHLLAVLGRPKLDPTDHDQRNIFGIEDIFARKITRELLNSKRHAEITLQNLAEGIIEVTPAGEIVFANAKAVKILGRLEEQLLGTNLNDFEFTLRGRPTNGILDLMQNGEIGDETVLRGATELAVKLLSVSENSHSIAIVILSDVTERMRAERQIQRSLAEKEVLLKEVHHRVKNNLAMIASLISLEATYLKDPRDVDVLEQLRDRIQSISLVHEQLYLSDDLAHVDLSVYLRELATNLAQLVSGQSSDVQLQVDVEPVRFTVDLAIPLGLIVTELVTNSLKYAFPAHARGSVNVRLERGADAFRLTVSDDGVGLPANVSLRSPTTLGLQLVASLSLQLRGRISSTAGRGTTIAIDFPDPSSSA